MPCERCAILEARLRPVAIQRGFGLSPSEAAIVERLWRAYPKLVRRESLYDLMVRDDHAQELKDEANHLGVRIWHIRDQWDTKAIETVRGQGYRMTDFGRSQVDAVLAE